MAPRPDGYIQFLPAVYRQPDPAGSAAFLETYLEIFQQITGRRLAPSSDDPPDTVVRKGLADIVDVLPSLFYPRLSFLFPGDDAFIPPLNPANPPNQNYFAEKLNELNDYFGVANPPQDGDWQAAVTAAVSLWLSQLLAWQAAWIDLDPDDSWSLDKQRQTLATILPVFRQRGTAAGLKQLLQLFVGDDIEVLDAVTAPPMTVGRNTALKSAYQAGDAVVGGVRPFAFVVQLTVATYDMTSPVVERTVAAIRALVDAERPAHTNYTVEVKTRPVKLGVYSRVGVDFLLPIEKEQSGGA